MRPVAIASHYPSLRFARRDVVRMIHALDAHHGGLATKSSVLANDGELSLVFVDDQALAALHAQFLDDPTITDVITFEGNPMLGTAGEICVSVDAALRHIAGNRVSNSRLRHRRTRDCEPIPVPRSAAEQAAFSRELALYLVHGWLHLAGYDDLVPAKKRVMRQAEARALALLEREHALPVFSLRRR